jgi:hypothetical protein
MHCTTALAQALRRVPGLLDDLVVTWSKQDRLRAGGGHRGKQSEAPLPVRFDITPVIAALGNELTTWARDLVDRHGWDVPDPPRRRPHNTAKPDIPSVGAQNLRRGEVGNGRGLAVFPASSPSTDLACYAAVWLADHSEQLRMNPAVMEAHRGITGAIAAAENAIDRPEARLFIGACDTCDAALYAKPDDRNTRCDVCGTSYADVAERWDRALFRLRGYPATAALIAGSIGELYGVIVSRKLINSWHHRRMISKVDDDPDTSDPRFRIGEVLDRAAKSQPRKGRMIRTTTTGKQGRSTAWLTID